MATAAPRLYSVRQAAAMAGVSEKTIRRWIKRGLLRLANREGRGAIC